MGVAETGYSSNLVTERVIDSGIKVVRKTGSETTYVEAVPHKFDRPHFVEVMVSFDGVNYYPHLKSVQSFYILTMWMDASNYYFGMGRVSSSPETIFYRYFIYWNDLDE